jgi:hypothetical protein
VALDGEPYGHAAEDGLINFDGHLETEDILRKVYGAETGRWMRRGSWFFPTPGLSGYARTLNRHQPLAAKGGTGLTIR